MLNLEQLTADARSLPSITQEQTQAYSQAQGAMTELVNQSLEGRADINTLIGHNPLQVMHGNHRHHAAFMVSVFSLGDHGLLARTMPWVYHTYHSHHFSFDYFPVELKAWQAAVRQKIEPELALGILQVYDWMLSVHEDVIHLSSQSFNHHDPADETWRVRKESFQSAALAGDHRKCLDLVSESIKSATDIESFYLQVLQPVMYEVGFLWEKAEVSIAQEHLVAAIVNRVMVQINSDLPPLDAWAGRAVISASPNEFHEIGSRMLADVLEQDGWEVFFLGANVPEKDLVDLVRELRPTFVAISVTLPFNLAKAQSAIAALRSDAGNPQLKIMVGGRAFGDGEEIWRNAGADSFASDIHAARELARNWRS